MYIVHFLVDNICFLVLYIQPVGSLHAVDTQGIENSRKSEYLLSTDLRALAYNEVRKCFKVPQMSFQFALLRERLVPLLFTPQSPPKCQHHCLKNKI